MERPSSSVYDSESGEPPDSLDDCNETPGIQGNNKATRASRNSNRSGLFEELLESFPSPPRRDQAAAQQTLSHIPPGTEQALPRDSIQANTSTITSSLVSSVTSSHRDTRFSQNLRDSGLAGGCEFSRVRVNADTSSAIDINELASSPISSTGISPASSIGTSRAVYNLNVSLRVPPLPRASLRDLLSITHFQKSQHNLSGDTPQETERSSRYNVFPASSPVRPTSRIIRSEDTRATLLGGTLPKTPPRFYRKNPLRSFPRASLSSFATRRSTSKAKAFVKRCVKKLSLRFRLISSKR